MRTSIKPGTAKYLGAVLTLIGLLFGVFTVIGMAMLAPVGIVMWAAGYIREAIENQQRP